MGKTFIRLTGKWRLVETLYRCRCDGETVEESVNEYTDGEIVMFNGDGTGGTGGTGSGGGGEMRWKLLREGVLRIADRYGVDVLTVERIGERRMVLSESRRGVAAGGGDDCNCGCNCGARGDWEEYIRDTYERVE